MRDSQPEAVLSTGGWRITGPLSTREAILQVTEDVVSSIPALLTLEVFLSWEHRHPDGCNAQICEGRADSISFQFAS